MSRIPAYDSEALDSGEKGMDGIHVSVRIRPLSSAEILSGIQPCCTATSNSSLVISKVGDSGAYLKSQSGSAFNFAFDAVFDETASQTDVYNKSAKPYVVKAIQGENVTIFAYGATGAGKTHTMFGSTRFDSTAAFAGAGIIPQAVADLFHLLNARIANQEKGESWGVTMSYMEVYNEKVCDLLNPVNKDLPLREDPARGVVIVAGLSDFKVTSYDEVLDLLMKGQVNRKTESTKANNVSSRSHAILQFTVTRSRSASKSTPSSSVESKLSLIDLAGSERAHATQNSGVRLQESANINKSLLALANCINALSERSNIANALSPSKGKKNTNVKYRDSKLTHLLKGSLEGNCNLVMIANVNPADTTHDDTYRTLNYANRAKHLKVKPIAKELAPVEVDVTESELRLKEENDDLRNRLAMLEQNAQQQSESEQQLLQALAQALGALNAAKTQSEAGVIGERMNHHSHAKGIAAAANSMMMDESQHSKYGGFNSSGRDSTSSVVPEYNTLAGHKSKRDSMGSGSSAHGNGYNTRSSIGSIVYGMDGESDDEKENERRQSEGAKARRISTESSPRTRSSDASVKGRLSNGSTAGRPPAKGPAKGAHSVKGAANPRLSNGSTNGRASLPHSKPARLSSDIVKQYEVLATVANPSQASNNAANLTAEPRAAEPTKPEKFEDVPLGGPTTRSSFGMANIRTSFGGLTGGGRESIHIDPRYQYSHGSDQQSPPKQNFITRFLCGVKRK